MASLNDMANRTPRVDPRAVARASLAAAVMDAITPQAMTDVTQGLIKAAKGAGEPASQVGAAKLLFQLAGAMAPAQPAPPVRDVVVVENVPAHQLRTLVALKILWAGEPLSQFAACALTGLPNDHTEGLLDHPWFQATPEGWVVTPAGKQCVA